MRCGNCGKARVDPNRRFCNQCGKPFSNVAPTVIDESMASQPAMRVAPAVPPGAGAGAAGAGAGPAPSRAIAALLTAPRKEASKRLSAFLVRAFTSLVVCYGATCLVGYVAMTYGERLAEAIWTPGEEAKSGAKTLFLILAFVTNAIVGFTVGALLKPRRRAKRAMVVVGSIMLLVATVGREAPARAEVPEHNPGLDVHCGKGFQWSRGTVSCKQADCPAGAGRTYTYECNCGEAWGKPMRTCYGEGGLVTKCVAQSAACDDPAGKIAGGFFIGLGTFIWYCALVGSAPITAGPVIVGGAAIGYGAWLWNRGRPGPLQFGKAAFEAKVRTATDNARKAVDGLNSKMRGGFSDDDLKDLGVIYENWLNATPQQKEQLRLELEREGIDVVKLGDAVRFQKDGILRDD